jgi:hypothetical protein
MSRFEKEFLMKRSFTLASLVLGLFLSAPVMACQTDEGYLSQVDTAAKQVVVKKGDKTRTFTTADKTVVTVNGKAATLADLKAGDKVIVDFESATDVLAIKVSRDA